MSWRSGTGKRSVRRSCGALGAAQTWTSGSSSVPGTLTPLSFKSGCKWCAPVTATLPQNAICVVLVCDTSGGRSFSTKLIDSGSAGRTTEIVGWCGLMDAPLAALQASMMLESSTAIKNKSVREAAFRLVSALAMKYQQLDVVVEALVDLMNKHEHLPSVLAELADFSNQHHSNPRLVIALCSWPNVRLLHCIPLNLPCIERRCFAPFQGQCATLMLSIWGIQPIAINMLSQVSYLLYLLLQMRSFVQGVEMLREVASVDPHEYDQQQKDDAGGIRNASTFVQELAERYEPPRSLSPQALMPLLADQIMKVQ